jgi:hypothetical protein
LDHRAVIIMCRLECSVQGGVRWARCVAYKGRLEMHAEFLSENVKADYIGDVSLYERIVLKWIVKILCSVVNRVYLA